MTATTSPARIPLTASRVFSSEGEIKSLNLQS